MWHSLLWTWFPYPLPEIVEQKPFARLHDAVAEALRNCKGVSVFHFFHWRHATLEDVDQD
jgi:hypothetical protein